MSANAGKKRLPLAWSIAIAIIGILIILAIATAAYFFFRYRQAGNQHVDASQSRVIISQPATMAQFPAGLPIEVQVNAVGQQPFTSIELWINGVLEGVQASPPSGLTSLAASFSWIPPSGGNYSLVARAINTENGAITSPAVFVFVTPPENSGQLNPEAGKVYPAVYPAAPSGESNPQAPAGEEVPAPAVPWQGTPADWLTDLSTGSTPVAPELAVTADGCSVKLDIHDLSDNEEGFALYRQTTANPYWAHAADLASHAGQGWIETQDADLSGGVTYYVAAFNSMGQSSSNLALVNLDPQACPAPQPPAGLTTLDLKVSNLALDESVGNVYCYSNLGGRGWSRWPEMGFLTSREQEIPLLAKSLLLSSLSDSGITPGPQSMDLKLECWGWEEENYAGWAPSWIRSTWLLPMQSIQFYQV